MEAVKNTRKNKLNVNTGNITSNRNNKTNKVKRNQVNEKKYLNVNSGNTYSDEQMKGIRWMERYFQRIKGADDRLKRGLNDTRRLRAEHKKELDELFAFQNPSKDLLEQMQKKRGEYIKKGNNIIKQQLNENAENRKKLASLDKSSNEYNEYRKKIKQKRRTRANEAHKHFWNRTEEMLKNDAELRRLQELEDKHLLEVVLPKMMKQVEEREKRGTKEKD